MKSWGHKHCPYTLKMCFAEKTISHFFGLVFTAYIMHVFYYVFVHSCMKFPVITCWSTSLLSYIHFKQSSHL